MNILVYRLLLIGLVIVPYAYSLTCYSCKDAASCSINKDTHVCNDTTANDTRLILAQFYNQVPEINSSSSYECLNLKYTNSSNSVVVHELRGCVHPGMNSCSLNLTSPTNLTGHCYTCTSNYCNPAGTFSISKLAILGSLSALLIAQLAR